MSFKESQTGKFLMNERVGANNDIFLPENEILRAAAKQRAEKELAELNAKLIELAKEKQEELDAKLQTLELMPLFNKVVLLPYPENPYRKIAEGNIILDYTGDFNNPDSGEKDKLKVFVGCAKVIEIGPDCKFLKPNDDVFYDTRTCYPVPFAGFGYILTTEPQILVILNDGLKDRFNKIKNPA